MTTWALLAPGPSLNIETADYVRGRLINAGGTCAGVIAVSNAYTLAPWAAALVSHDAKWWRNYNAAFDFAGRKFCRFKAGVEVFNPPGLPTSCNSGLMAIYVAQRIFKASKIILCGFDMHGTHFFGRHPDSPDLPPEKRLKNTSDARRQTFLKQFAAFDAGGMEVINCTAGSAIKTFKFMALGDAL